MVLIKLINADIRIRVHLPHLPDLWGKSRSILDLAEVYTSLSPFRGYFMTFA
jgi:hypothetical protein